MILMLSVLSAISVRQNQSAQDEIPNFIIKGCADIFIPLLRHIFNLSLSTGKFPSLWKHATVVPVFKKRNSPSG
jgi:hypothetical protein